MGAAVGTDDDKSVNVELNVVPFIDLMTCLVAFLLVTAIWVHFAQINIKPKGLGRDATKPLQEDIPVNASVLVTPGDVWVGLTTGDRRQIRMDGDRYDWDALEDILREFQDMPVFAGRQDIEVAAEDTVNYQAIVHAMDAAVASGFRDIGFVDPQSLSVRFRE